MQPESAKLLGDAAVMLSLGTGVTTVAGNSWLSYLNNNAPAYGVLLTLIFGLCGIAFYVLSYKKATLADKNAIAGKVALLRFNLAPVDFILANKGDREAPAKNEKQ